MKIIKAEQTLTWKASSPCHRCVRDGSQAADGVTTSMISRQEPVNNANEDLRERFLKSGRRFKPVSKPSVGGPGADLETYLLFLG